jgi:hypothetical protein
MAEMGCGVTVDHSVSRVCGSEDGEALAVAVHEHEAVFQRLDGADGLLDAPRSQGLLTVDRQDGKVALRIECVDAPLFLRERDFRAGHQRHGVGDLAVFRLEEEHVVALRHNHDRLAGAEDAEDCGRRDLFLPDEARWRGLHSQHGAAARAHEEVLVHVADHFRQIVNR